MSDDNDPDAVGYRRPPKAHRFAKGKSGNPAGRPRKQRPEDIAQTAYERAANVLVTFPIDGEIVTMTRRAAFWHLLFSQRFKNNSVAEAEINRREIQRDRRLRAKRNEASGGVLVFAHSAAVRAKLDAFHAQRSAAKAATGPGAT